MHDFYVKTAVFLCDFHCLTPLNMKYRSGMIDSSGIKEVLMRAGAAIVGIAPAIDLPETEEFIRKRYSEGDLAGMSWLGKTARERTHPSTLLSGARVIISTAWQYSPERRSKHFARYALSIDYHDFIMERLTAVWKTAFPDTPAVLSVDAGHIAEKPYSELAGLGWIGKNSILINPKIGSFFCIGVIITTLDIETDLPHKKMCGDCRRCIDACPTGAIHEDGWVDCRRCISYLTIEEKGDIPEGIRPLMGGAVFGCDICQEVCPYNVLDTCFRRDDNNVAAPLIPSKDIEVGYIGELMCMDGEEFRNKFFGTPVFRVGRHRLIRNVAIALNNLAGKDAQEFLRHSLHYSDSLIQIPHEKV